MNRKVYRVIRAMKFLYVVINVLFFFCFFSYLLFQNDGTGFIEHYRAYSMFMFLYGTGLVYLIRVYNGFAIGDTRVSEIVYSLSLANLIENMVLYLGLVIYSRGFFGVTGIVFLTAIQILFNVCWTVITNRIFFMTNKPLKTAYIYLNQHDLNKLKFTNSYRNFIYKHDVCVYIENPQTLEDVVSKIENCEAIFIAGIHSSLRNSIIKYTVEHHIQVFLEPKIGDILMANATHIKSHNVPMFRIHQGEKKFEYLVCKRLMDIVVSLAALVVLSPLMLIIAVLIKAYDHGPIFYKQVRLTKGGKQFTIYKFRSMSVDAEIDGVARLASENDHRITPIGKLIRSTRIDELPQLFNILKGEMTLVGPRPERPEIMREYEKTLPEFKLRLRVKAGLTGYAQVYGRYNTLPYDKLEMDLMYINDMSLMKDLWIILMTIKILFVKESTQGIIEDKEKEEL